MPVSCRAQSTKFLLWEIQKRQREVFPKAATPFAGIIADAANSNIDLNSSALGTDVAARTLFGNHGTYTVKSGF